MVASDVQSVLNQLGGVYRDPTRVSRDSSSLLSNTLGRALRPSVAALAENNGAQHPRVLCLSGTIVMVYRSARYNVPVDVYLPPEYPNRPPLCFVRPVSTMILRENHRHVARDGMVYMPYLHEWKRGESNLTNLVSEMSAIFGNDPPVYAKPAGGTSSSTSDNDATASTTAASIASIFGSFSPKRSSSGTASAAAAIAETAERRAREQAEAAEREQRAEEARQELQSRQTHTELKEQLTLKFQTYLSTFYNEARTDISSELRNQAKLDHTKTIIQQQLDHLRQCKRMLSSQTTHVEEQIQRITNVVDAAERAMSCSNDDDAQGGINVDALALPVDAHSRQMLDLVAKNASITDSLYFMDKALVKGKVTVEVHLKTVRHFAKKQFFVKAHMIKIASLHAGGGGLGGSMRSLR